MTHGVLDLARHALSQFGVGASIWPSPTAAGGGGGGGYLNGDNWATWDVPRELFVQNPPAALYSFQQV